MSAPAAGRSRRRGWLVAALAALVTIVVPLAAVEALSDDPPEIRVIETAGRLSALVVDGDTRLLVINTADREAAGALLGRIAAPWEPRPKTLVAPADDDAAPGLWEALRRLDPATVVVAGVPGADPLWSAIEAETAARGIVLSYVTTTAALDSARLGVTILGVAPDGEGGAAVVVRRGEINVVIALDAVAPRVDGQALVFNGEPERSVALLLTSRAPAGAPERPTLVVGERAATRLVLDEDRLRARGGVLRAPVAGGD